MIRNLLLFAFIGSVFSSSLTFAREFVPEKQKVRYEVLTERKDVIWGFDFLKDGRIIFTERGGKIFIFDPKTKRSTQVKGAPQVHARGQGGLLDIRVHPANGKIFLTYSEPANGKSATALAVAFLVGDELKSFKKIYTAHEASTSDIHYGSRIEFDGKGHVFFTVGDRNDRKRVQDLAYSNGKVIRLKEDGSIPEDNPFKKKGQRPEIFAYGIRSPQGLAFRPQTNELWLADMGPRGGDEINIIEAGKNYGWPDITHGREYYGPKIGEGTEKVGVVPSVVYWVPSISPSAIAFYDADVFPAWKGNVFVACLSGQQLRRLKLDGSRVVSQEVLLENVDRFRNVRSGPDGYLYLSTDSGKLGRLLK
ncbi:PQQ-dependent sugar dehydrogenase [Pseudobdellovibrio exovorus]|uniref:Glucose/Sorbosone dehydrogenase domain-containing protein n=1 Tax=Pseudobdellovibrio exovorus JSS TaxID=1184267 RepID=M4VAD2_9BACT|nr:PQQ-dependent sugar dehydrogenase [Pseudobdellovibrio exovorus]AGH96183.1 hypothetical protein A11Q_1967 [Pseudobdellovibrio exovorus JSS]